MSISHTILRQYRDQSSNAIQLSETPTGNAEKNFDQLVPIAANTHYLVTLIRSQLLSLCIYAADAITLYTNAASGGSPTDTIAIVAGQALVWTLATDGLSKCPLSADVTSIYVTNATAAAVAFKLRALLTQ